MYVRMHESDNLSKMVVLKGALPTVNSAITDKINSEYSSCTSFVMTTVSMLTWALLSRRSIV